MSFFYGLGNVNATTKGTSNGTIPDAFDEFVLPGHKFKDVYATSTIAVDLFSLVALIILFVVIWISRQPEPPQSLQADKKALEGWKQTWRPTRPVVHAVWTFILHLLMDLVIRVCIELRLTVPYAFTAIEVPSKVFLMIADLNLAYTITVTLGSLWQRLNDGRWWREIYNVLIFICGVLWCLLFIGERCGNTYMKYKFGFRWNQPDTKYSAALALAYATNMLCFAIATTFTALRLFIIYCSQRQRVGYDTDLKPCGKLPSLSLFVLTPAFLVRSASLFGFVYFFQWSKRLQNPDLELPRMLLDCVPAVVIVVTLAIIRRSDRKMKEKWDQQQALAPTTVYVQSTKFDGPVAGPGYYITERGYQPYEDRR